MSRIPERVLQNIRDQINILEIVESKVTLKKYGQHYKGLCPFHSEKSPSFVVNVTKQFYHCFGCGNGGDVIKFLQEYDGLSFIEAVTNLANEIGIILKADETQESKELQDVYATLEIASNFYQQNLKQHTISAAAVHYLKQRGLNGLTAKLFNLGFAPDSWDNLYNELVKHKVNNNTAKTAGLIAYSEKSHKNYDRFRNRIIFPIRNVFGQVIGFGGRILDAKDEPKYLNSQENIAFNKGAELYGLFEHKSNIRKAKQVVVVEGYMDVIILAQHGLKNVVGTLGTACSIQHIKKLFKYANEIVFCFDGDDAGRKAAIKAMELSLALLGEGKRIKFLLLPQNCDPDSFVTKYGLSAFLAKLDDSLNLFDFMLKTLSLDLEDLASVEDKFSLISKAKEYIQQIANPILRQLMYNQLSEQVGIAITEDVEKTVKNSDEIKNYDKKYHLDNNLVKLLALLLYDRELLKIAPSSFSFNFNGQELYFSVRQALMQTQGLGIEDAITNIEPEFVKKLDLAKMREMVDLIPLDGREAEFLGCLNLLEKTNIEVLIQQLILKAKQNTISYDERVTLQELLSER